MKVLGDSNNFSIISPDLYVKPCESCHTSKCDPQVLLKENYLSEFKTLEEKNKVKENLGLLDNVIQWGEIGGYIENQKDLNQAFLSLKKYMQDLLAKNSSTLRQLINKKIDKEILTGVDAVSQISYVNDKYNITSLKDALDVLFNQELNITITCTPSKAETGSKVQSITYQWSFNRDNIQWQKFNDETIDVSQRSITISGNYTSNVIGKLEVNDGHSTYTKQVQLSFYPGIYYGILDSEDIDLDSMLSLNCLLQENRNTSITVDANDVNDYIYICIPYDYGIPEFSVNGFYGGFTLLNDNYMVDKYNTSNPIRYQIYRSDNKNLGKTTVIIH